MGTQVNYWEDVTLLHLFDRRLGSHLNNAVMLYHFNCIFYYHFSVECLISIILYNRLLILEFGAHSLHVINIFKIHTCDQTGHRFEC